MSILVDLINLLIVTASTTAIGTKSKTRNKNLRVCPFAIEMRAEKLCHLCRHTAHSENRIPITNRIRVQNF